MLQPRDHRGFTLVEVTIILLVLVILATIMLPQMGNFNRLARFVKAREDVAALCSVMKKMLDEVMLGAFFVDPRPNGRGGEPIGLLVGPGSTPDRGSKGEGRSGIRGDSGHWRRQPGERFEVGVDGGPRSGHHTRANVFWVDEFENHLQQNMPLDGGRLSKPYKNPLDNPERWAAGAFFGWRGPYLDELTTDPWGNRYASNVFALYKNPLSEDNDEVYTSAVVCYSAGPDSGIDTIFNQPMNDADQDFFYGFRFMDDDLGAILSAGGPF